MYLDERGQLVVCVTKEVEELLVFDVLQSDVPMVTLKLPSNHRNFVTANFQVPVRTISGCNDKLILGGSYSSVAVYLPKKNVYVPFSFFSYF
jgi:hypothetical protein